MIIFVTTRQQNAVANKMETVIKRSLRTKLKTVLGILVALILVSCGCDQESRIRIDRDSVKVVQGRYTGETIDLTFYAELTDSIPPYREVYWCKGDGQFHSIQQTSNGVTLSYEVFNPFGELDLKTLSDNVGPSKTVTFPLPVFSTPENPYEYTLRVTFYFNGRKYDTYRGKFRLTHP